MSGAPEPIAEGALLFVYAADSGLFNAATGIAHKILSPRTYPCRLCALTHGYFSVRKEWPRFIASLEVPCGFIHRDHAAGMEGVDPAAAPAVYRRSRGRWSLCLSSRAIATCRSLPELQAAVSAACTQ